MTNKSENHEPIREILLGGAAGAVLGGLIAFSLAFVFTGSLVLAPILATQGAMTGAIGASWATAMLLVRTDDEQTNKGQATVAVPVRSTSEQRTALRRVA